MSHMSFILTVLRSKKRVNDINIII